MLRGMRSDLLHRLETVERDGMCLTPLSHSDSRRLNRAVERGDLIVVHRGVYARATYWSTLNPSQKCLHIAHTLAQKHPAWVFCGPTAALAHGLSVSHRLLGEIHIAIPRRSHTRSCPGIIRHVTSFDKTVVRRGLCVTPLNQTVFDCLRFLDFPSALALADSALHLAMVRKSDLASYFDETNRYLSGRQKALEALRLADGRAESGGESIARATMIQLGFAIPDLQHEIIDPIDGGSLYRADFWWRLPDKSVVIGELDGREKYLNPRMTGGKDMVAVMASERLRESRISATGAKVMRFSYADVLNTRFFMHLLKSFGIPQDPAAAMVELPQISSAEALAYEKYQRERNACDLHLEQALRFAAEKCA